MQEEEAITGINKVVSDYFEKTSKADVVAVKELMPQFVQAGIFVADHKKGLPIRKVLRGLDEQGALEKIPCIHAERKDKNTFWYFVRPGHTYGSDAPNDTGLSKKQKLKINKAANDEHYVINLCDELLNEQASRQHKFDFLLGDFHKDGRTRSRLPVDAYYRDRNLVVELMEKQHEEPVAISEELKHRNANAAFLEEQKQIYAQRLRKALNRKDFNLIEIIYSSFECDSQKKLTREKDKDLSVLKTLLKDYL